MDNSDSLRCSFRRRPSGAQSSAKAGTAAAVSPAPTQGTAGGPHVDGMSPQRHPPRVGAQPRGTAGGRGAPWSTIDDESAVGERGAPRSGRRSGLAGPARGAGRSALALQHTCRPSGRRVCGPAWAQPTLLE